ncbi:MAG: hypothetical protein ACKVH8_21830 [Pirellulales bacterium]
MFQGILTRLLTRGEWHPGTQRLERLKTRMVGWELARKRLLFFEYADSGYTGGVVDLTGFQTIIVSR